MLLVDNIQSSFIEEVKKLVPPNLSFADELAEILDISRDSAYRRIRGETILSLEEVKKICAHFSVSLDTLLSPNKTLVSFHHRIIDEHNFTLLDWLKSIVNNLEMVLPFPSKEIVFTAKDIPPFHFYKFPKLAEFKMFFWMRSYLRYHRYADANFEFGIVPKEIMSIGEKVWDLYSCFPSVEIWSNDAGNVTLSQIIYYFEAGILSKQDAITVCDLYLDMLRDIQTYASQGHKGSIEGTYSLYHNEIAVSENNTLLKMGDKRVAIITYNTMNLLTTSQKSFCEDVENFMNNLMEKSTMISSTGEKERNKFFNHRLSTVEVALEKIKSSD